jgi:hypothetical protein
LSSTYSALSPARRHERQAAEELGRWKTRVEERKTLDVSPAAITLPVICTKTQMGHATRRGAPKALGSPARPVLT